MVARGRTAVACLAVISLKRCAGGMAVLLALGGCPSSVPFPGQDGGHGGGDDDAGERTSDAGASVDGGTDGAVADAGDSGIGDITPPDLSVRVMPGPARPVENGLESRIFDVQWRFDEMPRVAVEWTHPDVKETSVRLELLVGPYDSGVIFDAGIVASTGCNGDAGLRCFQLDAWPLPRRSREQCDFGMLNCTYELRAVAEDLSGNTATARGELRLTRFLWHRSLNSEPSAPAIDPSGNLYVSTSAGLLSLAPNGTARWATDGGRAVLHPLFATDSAAGDLVFFSEDSWLLALSEQGVEVGRCAIPSDRGITEPLALLRTGGRRVVIAPFDLPGDGGSRPQLLAMAIGPTLTSLSCDYVNSPAVAPTLPQEKSAPITYGNRYCFRGADDRIHCAALTDAGSWPVPPSFSVVDPTGLEVRDLVVARFSGGPRVFAAIGGTGHEISRLSEQGDAEEQTIMTASGSTLGPNQFLVGGSDIAPLGYLLRRGGGLGLFDLVSSNPLLFEPSIQAEGRSRPALLTAGGTVQVIESGFLREYVRTGNNFINTFPNTGLHCCDNGFYPTYDCNRTSGRGGVLYTSRLSAFLLEPRGLDVRAPWPKFMKDPANTSAGSLDTLRSYACP